MSKHTPEPWQVHALHSAFSGRVAGYDVQRIHNPYTQQARIEYLERGKVFRTEQQARAAIAKATGEQV